MNFLTPLAFVLAILIPIIIAMYLLKLRRTEQVVSSTYLWQRMVRDFEANAPWQRLRRNLLLILQLIFLLALIFSLARPFTWTEGSSSQATILIFDTSASMAANDISPNRLQAAKDQARFLISNLPQNASSTIISAGDNTQVLVSATQDKRLLLQTIENIYPQPGGSDMTRALELASAIASRQPDTEIVIYSDGKVDLPKRLGLQGQIRFIPIGESGENQAITLVTLEQGSSPDGLTAFIQVANYANEPVQRRLTIKADDQLIDAQDIEVQSQGRVSVISEIIPTETQILEAKLTGSDALALDNQAWTVQRSSENRNVNLVSMGNRFLETALGLLPGINLSTTSPEDWNNGEQQEADLIIFDSYTPPISDLQTTNLLYIRPISSTNTFSITGITESPTLQSVNSADPLLEYVDLKDISILDTVRISLPDWARPVLIDQISGDPLLFVGQTTGRRVATLSFDPRRSDLPLQVAYPILIANLVDWLLPGRIGDIPDQVKPGEAVTFTPPADVTVLTVTHPDGTSTHLDIQEGQAIFANTHQLGVYHVSWEDDQFLAFAVNLLNPQESDILPNQNLPLFDRAKVTQEDLPQQARREWWRPLAAFTLMILLIEWLVYNRANLSKLRHQITGTLKSET